MHDRVAFQQTALQTNIFTAFVQRQLLAEADFSIMKHVSLLCFTYTLAEFIHQCEVVWFHFIGVLPLNCIQWKLAHLAPTVPSLINVAHQESQADKIPK